MFGKKKPEVLIVGAGPVGMVAALALAKKGVRVTIADKQWRTGAHSYALALHPPSLRLLEHLGVGTKVLEQAYPVRSIGLYDRATRRAEMQIRDPEDPSLPLAVMRQDVLEHELEQALRRAGVKVLWNHAVSRLEMQADRVVATVDKMVNESIGYAVARREWVIAKTSEVEVPFVIGADGHQSLVRRSLGIDFPDLGGTQQFAVFEFESDAELAHELRIVMGQSTTNVLWPLPNGHCRWSFQLLDFTAPVDTRTKKHVPVEIGSAHFPVLDEDRLRELLADRAPWFKGRIGNVRWRIVVRFERRLADSFGKDRAWLAGDAAHLTGPVGVQSMNVGLREANDLAGILARVLREGGSVEPLQAYHRQRQAEWRCLLGQAGGLTSEDQTDPWVRDCSARLLPCIPASGTDLARMAEQLGLAVPAMQVAAG
jgi:2-polyprenyl-6-methoxyphenol hydroxylase-like FAD-dependent oxidoreductase